MNISAYRARAIEQLRASGSPDPVADAEWLISGALKTTRGALRLRGRDVLTQEQEEKIGHLLARRASGEPLQYVEGFACFMGLDFAVDPRVLIPRQDTETLCELAMEQLRGKNAPRMLDLCTGSGALAVSIAKFVPSARVTATDISADALDIARANARKHGVRVEFLRGDLFDPLPGKCFDLIVCNPPYLTKGDMDELQKEVKYEPAIALDGGADGLDFYRRIAADAGAHLAPGGQLLLEVGLDQADAVGVLLMAHMKGVRIETANDLNGIPRVVRAVCA